MKGVVHDDMPYLMLPSLPLCPLLTQNC